MHGAWSPCSGSSSASHLGQGLSGCLTSLSLQTMVASMSGIGSFSLYRLVSSVSWNQPGYGPGWTMGLFLGGCFFRSWARMLPVMSAVPLLSSAPIALLHSPWFTSLLTLMCLLSLSAVSLSLVLLSSAPVLCRSCCLFVREFLLLEALSLSIARAFVQSSVLLAIHRVICLLWNPVLVCCFLYPPLMRRTSTDLSLAHDSWALKASSSVLAWAKRSRTLVTHWPHSLLCRAGISSMILSLVWLAF